MRVALFFSAAILAASPVHAQNTQYQLRGVSSQTVVEVGSAQDVGVTSVAGGNAMTAVNEHADASLTNSQHMDGDTYAEADAVVWSASGAVAVTSAAVANGGTVTARSGNVEFRSEQLAHGDAAAATRFIGGDAGDAATSASAAGNVAAMSVENGQLRAILTQESAGSADAATEADHCCVAGQVVSGAVASANNASIAGDTATILTDTVQTAGARASARTDLYAGYAGDVSGNATANGNALNVNNQWGYVNARARQTSTADVSAQSYVTLGGDFTGFASAGAYGVGNSTLVTNAGSDTVLDVEQTNAGGVYADAALVGEGGDMALASSAAYGNSVSASLCGYCDTNTPALSVGNDQVNGGDVSARASVVAPRARIVGATATAIGNAATVQSTGPSGG